MNLHLRGSPQTSFCIARFHPYSRVSHVEWQHLEVVYRSIAVCPCISSVFFFSSSAYPLSSSFSLLSVVLHLLLLFLFAFFVLFSFFLVVVFLFLFHYSLIFFLSLFSFFFLSSFPALYLSSSYS